MYLKSFIESYKSNGFDLNEAKSEISFALEVLFNYTYKDFTLNKMLEDWQIDKAQKVFDERTNTRRPLQQILGKAYFFGRLFNVNKYTLIPRPETELLIQEVLKLAKGLETPKILDIGTGTGCIGITLALENCNIKADLADIQKEAIEIAKQNAEYHKVTDKINFIPSDLFDNIREKYDIIVSNPPYIPLKEKDKLQIEVRNFDSPIALFAKDEYGIEFYEKIIARAKNFLTDKGFIAFELGVNQAKKVSEILEENGFFQIKVTKDFNNIERIITASNFIV